MTTKEVQQGDIFKYAYRWKHELNKPADHQKERPVCLTLKLERKPGLTALALLPISDQPNTDRALSIPVLPSELKLSGLSQFREAYVHLSEVNFDRHENSYTFNPRAKVIGRFSKDFLQRIAKQLIINIKEKRVEIIHRK
jgi:hypothetical protein